MKGVYLKVSPWSTIPISQRIISKNLRQQGYRINKNPYITVLPSVKSEVEFDLPDFEPPHDVSVSGIGYYPDIEDPREIYLDVSDDMVIQLWRDELMRQVPSDKLIDQPERMRISLIENTKGDKIDAENHDRLVEFISDFNPPDTVTGIGLGEEIPEYVDKK